MLADNSLSEKLKITFHGIDPSPALEQQIRDKAHQLFQHSRIVTHCQVVVEIPHHHHQKGNLYHVRLDIKVPDKEIVINKDPGEKKLHTDPSVAIRDAFRAAEQILKKFKQERHSQVKYHALPLHGRIGKLEDNYGYIYDFDNSEIYFNEKAVHPEQKFKDLKIDDVVHFTLGEGEEGNLHASMVKKVKHHGVIDDLHSLKELSTLNKL
jgi:ribosome-associated translation inhibitor RaiA